MVSGEADANFLDLARLASDLDIHWRTADLAVLDRRVIALRSVGSGGDDLSAVRALDLNFDEHGLF